MKTNNATYVPQEILELIPWFTTGKLSLIDQAFFENALLLYPSLQKQLELEQQTIQLVSADHSLLDRSAIAAPSERLKSIFNVIDNPELPSSLKSRRESDLTPSLMDKLKSTFSSIIPKPQYTQFASVSVLVLSIAVLASFNMPINTVTSDFIPASAVTQPTGNQAVSVNSTKTILLVGFNGSSAELSNNSALKGKQTKIESPPDKAGFYQVSFQDSMNADEIKQTIDALLAQQEAVWFAGEAF